MSLRIHRLAVAEIDREADYYESRQAGLGAELEDEIDAAFSLILRFPEAAPQWRDRADRRVAVLDRFPFTIPYQIAGEDTVVLALAHTSQSTGLLGETRYQCCQVNASPPHRQSPSCAKTRSIGLRGLTVIELEDAAEPCTAHNRACADRRGLGRNELVAQTLVRPLLVIMLDKRSYGRPEVPFAERHDPLQALGLGRLNKPLGKCVQIWTPGGQDQWLHATAPQQAPKGGGVERVSVQDQVLSTA
jgi:plasmid stabilization system protein ParE